MSVLVCVPKVLDVLREHMQRALPETAGPGCARRQALGLALVALPRRRIASSAGSSGASSAARRRSSRISRRSGASSGFLVVQGYGLTETAPIVTLNHPFRASRGTVGTPIAGVEVRIADDGEILVRGENVTSGYYNPPTAPAGSARGWRNRHRNERHGRDRKRRGVPGRMVPHGRHRRARRDRAAAIKGRKKEMIVTPQGLNVFPEDVERALIAQPGVVDAGVIGLPVDGEERIHAVLVLEPGADVDGDRAWRERHPRGSPARLEHVDLAGPHSAADRGHAEAQAPRTAAVGHRRSARVPRSRPTGRTVEEVVGRFAAGRELKPETTLDELGLSSLDRVELMMALEDAFQITLDEGSLDERRSRWTTCKRRRAPVRPTSGAGRRDGRPRRTKSTSAPSRQSRTRPTRTSRSLFPDLEPLAGRVVPAPHQPAHLDSSARPCVPAAEGRRARAPATTWTGR